MVLVSLLGHYLLCFIIFQVLRALKISEDNNSHKTISNAGKRKEVTLAIKVYHNKNKNKKRI
jgi:hypothetical protein